LNLNEVVERPQKAAAMAVRLHLCRSACGLEAPGSQDTVASNPVHDSRAIGGVAIKTPHGQAYNEGTFRYLLGVERRRSARSNRRFLLVLLHLRPGTGSTLIDGALAFRFFSGLWQSVRETDFVGWFEQGRVAGAVLTQYSDAAGRDAERVVAERVRTVLKGMMSGPMADRFRVRVYLMPRGIAGRPA
jgi:hypothetical protein